MSELNNVNAYEVQASEVQAPEVQATEVQATEVQQLSNMIELLSDGAKLKDVIAKLNEVITALNAKPTKERDRGPDSTREMTEDDARRALLGDLVAKSHKDAALELGLSYGQIYSARKGFTFKGVYKEFRELNK